MEVRLLSPAQFEFSDTKLYNRAMNDEMRINIPDIPNNGGEWMAAQRRLLVAGFRTNDKMTLQTVYNNMVERLGEEFAKDILFEEYMENRKENPISGS